MVRGLRHMRTMRNVWKVHNRASKATGAQSVGLGMRIGDSLRSAPVPKAELPRKPVRTWVFSREPRFARFQRSLLVQKMEEPLVDIFDKTDETSVIAELPGAQEKDIQATVRGDVLTIEAAGTLQKGTVRYYKEVLLPFPVKPTPSRRAFNNDILELDFERDKIRKARGRAGGNRHRKPGIK